MPHNIVSPEQHESRDDVIYMLPTTPRDQILSFDNNTLKCPSLKKKKVYRNT
jgi:hypothetical protein